MSDTATQSQKRTRARIALAASILLGLVFVASGSGKIIGFGEVPGQTVEFIGYIVPEALLTPLVVNFIYEIFIPYILPCVELGLGCLLIIGFIPRLMAVLCLPLSLALMGNNLWAIRAGMEKYASCACFGIWEEVFGELTPAQSLGIDIGLLALALVIIFVYPVRFLSSREWMTNLRKKKKTEPATDSTDE